MGRKRKHNQSRQWILDEIRKLSVDGIAPIFDEHKVLKILVKREFGTWNAACAAAGVIARGKGAWNDHAAAKLQNDKSNKVKNEFSAKFAVALGVMIEHGEVSEKVITSCMNAVRDGVLDGVMITRIN